MLLFRVLLEIADGRGKEEKLVWGEKPAVVRVIVDCVASPELSMLSPM